MTLRHRYRRILPGAAGLGFALLCTGTLRAQVDVNPPLPNVLLLVDTSGSMEYRTGTQTFPTCNPGSPALTNERSRWIDVIETLTGTIPSYSCQKVDRTSSAFATSPYGTTGPLGRTPYDYLYENPYHRPVSTACAPYPGAVDGTNAYNFPAGALQFRPYNSLVGTCTFPSASDGIMDAYQQSIRFGLMTFDTLPNAGTGVNAGNTPNHVTGIDGTWSYIPSSTTTPLSAHTGMPAGCIAPIPFEVGARNGAAPVWEGRMVPFGDPSPGSTDYQTKKAQIEQVLLSTRPYGATPIAGMLEDAYDFLLRDDQADPTAPTRKWGPATDPYVLGGCRRQFVILLSDGQPNMELRGSLGDPTGSCSDAIAGSCPFRKPEDIAYALTQGPRPIYTYVIGFALSSFTIGATTRSCTSLTDAEINGAGGLCQNAAYFSNSALQACCALNRIAVKGADPGIVDGPKRALFASNKQELTSALSDVLSKITPVTSRTQPVMSGAAGGAQSFRFYSSVKPVSFQPWAGVLERQRYTCEESTLPDGSKRHYAQAQPVNVLEGDDFARNVNSGVGRARAFFSVEAGVGAEAVYSDRTIRPYIPTASGDPDGVGVYKGEQYGGADSAFVSATSVEALQIQGKCTDLADNTLCRDRHMKWLVGIANGTPYSRCTSKGSDNCYLFGDILHSTPRVVPPPSEYLRDESYAAFRAAKINRPVTLYTSTNDGFLHAFKVTGTPVDMAGSDNAAKVAMKTNNELWAFIPPAVLPSLHTQYPYTHQVLLDGVPVVQDVVATITGTGGSAVIDLERTNTQAQTGTGDWRTILVQGFGYGRGGYFAIDVTDPDQLASYTSTTNKGPRFLWQLTTDESGTVKLFGKSGGTPLITTLYFDDGAGARQIPVAVLPGGRGDVTNPASQCPVSARTWTGIDAAFPARGRVRCYTGSDNVAARSLTIVRLDNGKIIRTFRQASSEIVLPLGTAQTKLRARTTDTNLDSPITGQPVAFPAGAGAIADRVFVGDQDGRLWKVSLASTNPANWTMNLFFDTYPASYGSDPAFPNGYDAGQPVQLAPVLSVNHAGDVTVNVATGDQDTIGASTTMKNFIWSLTEKTNSDRTTVTSQVNWFKALTGGERVVGPMALFNSALYFASYAPPGASDSVCSNGSSKVWGMHYVAPTTGVGGSPVLNNGGLAQLPSLSGKVQSQTAAIATGDSGATIYGVTIAQEPTCIGTSNTSGGDYMGYGSHTNITDMEPGKFQLVMHTGSGGTQIPGGTARVTALDLDAPVNATRIESWAALVE
ncbi:MAG: hypothetical protein M3020_07100 [Myxococcota bacterium]|nr:hypothetical protein [Myxococcota bacterium]